MASYDRMKLVNKRNRVGISQLQTELCRISKEEKNEMRMHNNEKQRFKKKYSKLDLFNDNTVTEASEIRMYETHNPGFCYRRNGDWRCLPASLPTSYVNFEDIHLLLFTNGDIDLEKVLCLHLFSTHSTNSLTPPPKTYNFFLPKELSPMERLIERSKKKQHIDKLIRLLPVYILEFPLQQNEKLPQPIIDCRIEGRLLTNDKIVQLIQTVMTALQLSNTHKMEELISMCKDEKLLKETVKTPRLQHFFKILKGMDIITSCESFKLSVPFKKIAKPLTIKTLTGQAEDLLKHIRKNIFQISSSTSKTELKEKNNLEEGTASRDEIVLTSEKLEKNESEYGLRMDPSFSSILSETETPRSNLYQPKILKQNIGSKDDLKKNLDAIPEKYKEGYKLAMTTSFHSKSQEATSSKLSQFSLLMKTFPPEEDGVIEEITNNTDLVEISKLLNDKIEELSKRDQKTYRCRSSDDEDESTPTTPISSHIPCSVPKKLLHCEACRARWKTPLPKPKVSDVKKVYMPVLDYETYNEIKSESFHKLSQMIDRSYTREMQEKISSNSKTSYSSAKLYNSSWTKNSFLSQNSIDTVELNELDLARIRQEIKENETRTKLQNFFKP